MTVNGSSEFDLNLVVVFARVVELGSFTGAAKALGLPKSSVSRAVTRLEESLGVRLLQRTTRKLGLTQAGARYLAEVRGPLQRLAEASSDVAELTREPRGLVRLSLTPELGDNAISPMLVEFVRRYPKVQIDLVITSRRVNLVEEGIDLAIRNGVLGDSSLVARKVANSALALYAAPSYLDRRGRPRRLSDLAAHDCIVYRSGGELMPWRLTGPRGMEQVSVRGPITADDLGSIRLLALAGLGVSLFPDVVVHADQQGGALERVLSAYSLKEGATYLVSPPLRHVPSRVTVLRDFLLEAMARKLAGTPCAVEPDRPPLKAPMKPPMKLKAGARR
jgi:DNA-binding transcriptional LysR family regulator